MFQFDKRPLHGEICGNTQTQAWPGVAMPPTGPSLWYGQHIFLCVQSIPACTSSICGCVCIYLYTYAFLFPFHPKKSFICHSLVTPGIPASPSFYLTFHPTSHTPHIFIPILFRGRSFQRPALSCTRRMGRWCWGYSAGRC